MKEPIYYSVDDEIDFGEYKGQTIRDILNKNINRITWYINHVETFLLDDEFIDAYCKRYSFTISKEDSPTGKQMTFKEYIIYFIEEKADRFYVKYKDEIDKINKEELQQEARRQAKEQAEERYEWLREEVKSGKSDAFGGDDGTQYFHHFEE